MTRLVIADDHAIVREGLKRIVAEAEGLEVVDEAGDGTQVMQRVRERVLAHFSWASIARQTLAFYGSLLNGARA